MGGRGGARGAGGGGGGGATKGPEAGGAAEEKTLKSLHQARIKNTFGNTVVANVNTLPTKTKRFFTNAPREGKIGKYSYKQRRADHIWNIYITKTG